MIQGDYFCIAESLKQLNKGEYFTKREIAYPKENQVWIKGEYNHTIKNMNVQDFQI